MSVQSYAAQRRADRKAALDQLRQRVKSLAAQGHSAKEIAQRVQISKREVKDIVAAG